MRRTVFYSWQSDLPNATNHAFIGGCLNEAVDSLSKGNDVADGLGLDRDTLDRQGSPEIAATIIEKIESCDAFVADVSIINPDVQLGERKTPNPNVLIELGYAAHARGWDRVICVCNTAFGRVEELPFDLRHRRVLPYSLSADVPGTAEVRSQLIAALKSQIAEVLTGNLALLRRELRAFFDKLDPSIMILIGQGHRSFMVEVPASLAQQLERLAADPVFNSLATFQSNGNFVWNDSRGPKNGYVVTVTETFTEAAT